MNISNEETTWKLLLKYDTSSTEKRYNIFTISDTDYWAKLISFTFPHIDALSCSVVAKTLGTKGTLGENMIFKFDLVDRLLHYFLLDFAYK